MSAQPNTGTPTFASAPVEAWQYEHDTSMRDLLGIFRRRWLVITLTAIVLATIVVLYDSLARTPTYEATIRIIVGQEQRTGPSNLGGDVQGLQQFTQTVARVVHTQTVADAVIKQLDLQMTPEAFLANMSARQDGQTQVVEVSYRDPNPERVQEIANTIGTVFSDQVSELSPSANAITATVWEEAALPNSPVSPNPSRDALLALILGGALGIGLAFLLEFLDDSWRSPEEAEQILGVPTFGVLREFETSEKSKKRGN